MSSHVSARAGGRSMAEQQISVQLDPDVLEFLKRGARRENRTVSSLLRHVAAEAMSGRDSFWEPH